MASSIHDICEMEGVNLFSVFGCKIVKVSWANLP
ncbi:MAG: hypothetical protein K0Q83_2264 [Deltaproteobacteria bacterium]|jgi:hypothetical protein|nr:hypothetical protein [Deltaproteobacteria bacterium]